jgi:hypothetical protein
MSRSKFYPSLATLPSLKNNRLCISIPFSEEPTAMPRWIVATLLPPSLIANTAQPAGEASSALRSMTLPQ